MSMQNYIYVLISSALIGSLILYVTPDTKSKSLIELTFICSMLLICIKPIINDSGSDFFNRFNTLKADLEMNEDAISDKSDLIMENIIESQYNEYILREALNHNISLQDVRVLLTDHDGYMIPWEIIYTSSSEITSEFKDHICSSLGVPTERQYVHEDS